MNNRLFINTKPGNTFLDKLTGKTKVRLFFLLIAILIATWDIRLIAPLFVIFLLALLSIKPNPKRTFGIIIFVVLMNLFNLFLIWIVSPDYGANIVGASTVLFKFNDFYIITKETLWYFMVRFTKFIATFLLSLTFIQSITPSEIAAGLHSIKIPYKICTIVSIAFRYIPDITRDFNSIKISMQARGMELDPKKSSLGARLKQNVLILAPLIITSFDRVGNISNAMDLRGFGKKKDRTYYSEHEDTKWDKILGILVIILVIVFIGIVVKHVGWPSKYEVWAPWI